MWLEPATGRACLLSQRAEQDNVRIQALRDQMERGAVEPDLIDQDEIRRALRQKSIRALNDWLRRMREERHVS